jgi:two-component system, NtrC family, sensor kinase
MGVFQQLFSSDFMPHGFCYLWNPRIVWLHVISDGLITLSYYCIPVILVYFIHKNRDLPFNKIFWMFGTFILALWHHPPDGNLERLARELSASRRH